MKLEVCANGLQSAVIAMNAGAHRIELCTALELGGLTPSHALLEVVKENITKPTRVLVRPRRGHYAYSPGEIQIILRDIAHIASLGFEGVVIGALTPDYELHTTALIEMCDAAGTMGMTFHRAMDRVPDPDSAIAQLIEMGFDTVLSSGQRATALEGIQNLSEWQEKYGSKIAIMPGAGVSSEQVKAFRKARFSWIHASASSEVHITRPSTGTGVASGIPDHILRHTDSDKLRRILEAMNERPTL